MEAEVVGRTPVPVSFSHRFTAAFLVRLSSIGGAESSVWMIDAQAIAVIARLTGGNFRLLQWLFLQIERVLRINDLRVITNDVVEAARSPLVIGAT